MASVEVSPEALMERTRVASPEALVERTWAASPEAASVASAGAAPGPSSERLTGCDSRKDYRDHDERH